MTTEERSRGWDWVRVQRGDRFEWYRLSRGANLSEHVNLLERELVSLRNRVLGLEARVCDMHAVLDEKPANDNGKAPRAP